MVLKKMQKPKGSKHTSRCVVAIKNPGIFRYFWSVLGRLIAHVYTLNLVLKLTCIKKRRSAAEVSLIYRRAR